MEPLIPTTVNVQAIIKSHPRVSSRLEKIPQEIKDYEKRQESARNWARFQRRHMRADESYFFKILHLKSEQANLLSGGPFWDESRGEYLQRCASVFIEAMYQLEQSGDTDSADHRRFRRYLESVNAQLSAPNVSVSVRQTVNVIQAMGLFMG